MTVSHAVQPHLQPLQPMRKRHYRTIERHNTHVDVGLFACMMISNNTRGSAIAEMGPRVSGTLHWMLNYLQLDKMYRFEIFAFTMYHDLEIRVRGHWKGRHLIDCI